MLIEISVRNYGLFYEHLKLKYMIKINLMLNQNSHFSDYYLQLSKSGEYWSYYYSPSSIFMMSLFLFVVGGYSRLLLNNESSFLFVCWIIDYNYESFSYTLLLLCSSPALCLYSLAILRAYYNDLSFGAADVTCFCSRISDD